ncbi:MAG: helix-turn-helix domain-containing protein, partial [Pseudomonadota bacterium]
MFDFIPETDARPSELSDQLTPGERLRLAREARGETIKDIASRTHQSVDTLRALEAMQTDGMSATLIRMHAARYAKAVDLPSEDLANAYASARAMMSLGTPDISDGPRFTQRFRKSHLAVAACALAAVSVALMTGLQSEEDDLQTVPVSTRILAQQAVQTKSDRERMTARPLTAELAFRAKRSGWIEVRASDGTVFRSRDMSVGEVYYPRLNAGWTVTVRDASAFEVMLDGQSVMDMGDASPRYSLSVDQVAKTASAYLKQNTAERQQSSRPQN